MQVLHDTSDPFLNETLRHVAINGVEGPFGNARVQMDTVTLTCTANVPQSESVTFKKPFKSGNTPVVVPGITSMDNPSSHVTVSTVHATNTSVTIQANSDVDQSLTVSFIAIGQTS